MAHAHDRQLPTVIAMRGTECASSDLLFRVMYCTYRSISANRAQAHSERVNVVELEINKGRENENWTSETSERRTDGKE